MSDDAGLKVVVSADVQQLQVGADQAVQSLTDMEKELNAIGRAIDNTVAKGQDIGKLEDAYQALADKIKAAKAAAASPLPVPPAPPIPPPVPVPCCSRPRNTSTPTSSRTASSDRKSTTPPTTWRG